MNAAEPSPLPVKLDEKFALISDHWNPRIVARYNGNEVRLVKVLGDFTWHSHADTDELFLVVAGDLQMEFRDRTAQLGPGEMIVVPRGVEHRPRAERECLLLVLDREGEPNTGIAPSHLSRAQLETL